MSRRITEEEIQRLTNQDPFEKMEEERYPGKVIDKDLTSFLVSESMCRSCEKRDSRAVQEAFNRVTRTAAIVASFLEVDDKCSDWEEIDDALRDWCSEQRSILMTKYAKKAAKATADASRV